MSELASLSRLLLGAQAPPGAAGPARTWRGLLAAGPSPGGSGDPGAVVRGVDPVPNGTGPLRLLAFAAERELVLARLRRRPPVPYASVRVVRTRPPVARVSPLRSARSRLAGGAAVLLGDAPASRSLLDDVLAAAGVDGEPLRLRPGSGGAVLVRACAAGRPVVLRVGPVDVLPRASTDALEAMSGSPLVPRLLGQGRTAGVAWTVEELLPGRRPPRLGTRMLQDAAAFAGSMPPGTGPPPGSSAHVVAGAVPRHAAALAEVGGRARDAVAGLPSVAVHGDLWSGNLLGSGGRLTGVVDWDAFRPTGPAGVDLLHLVATEERRRSGQELGTQVLRRPWAAGPFTSVAAPYWGAVGADPAPRELDGLGVVWWLDQVASTLVRVPTRAGDAHWVDVNVSRVIEELA